MTRSSCVRLSLSCQSTSFCRLSPIAGEFSAALNHFVLVNNAIFLFPAHYHHSAARLLRHGHSLVPGKVFSCYPMRTIRWYFSLAQHPLLAVFMFLFSVFSMLVIHLGFVRSTLLAPLSRYILSIFAELSVLTSSSRGEDLFIDYLSWLLVGLPAISWLDLARVFLLGFVGLGVLEDTATFCAMTR